MTMSDQSPEERGEDHSGPLRPASAPPLPTTDRGISPIAGRFGGKNSKMITLAALGLGCGILLFATWDRGDAKARREPAPDEAARQVVPFEPARRSPEAPQLSDAHQDADAPSLDGSVQTVPSLESGAGTRTDVPPRAADERLVLAETARKSPVLAYSRPGTDAGQSGHALRPVAAGSDAPLYAATGGTSLDALRQSSPIGQARAGVLPDRNYLLTAGTILPCILQTAMDSTTPGLVSCLLPADIYSQSGSVVLMERGTRILGQYQGGLQQGRSRLFVVWTRAVTPAGVAVSLASPASDALGRSGFDGRVDTHFRDRFGGALLLSLVDDGVYAAAGRDEVLRNTARLPSDAAAVVLGSSLDIPATLRKTQGSEVSIFVAQDLDFAGVYRLSLQ